jgi:glycosyltransferase involved in cell wall biosynthesis
MIIIHILNSLTVGGVEKVVVDICNNIDTKTHKVYILTLSNSDFKLKSELNDVEVISLPYKSSSALNILLFWLFGLPKMIKILSDLKPHIIHSHLYYHYFLFLSLGIRFSNTRPAHFRTIHTSGLFYSSRTLLNKFRLFIEKVGMKIYPVSLISISKAIHENNKQFFSNAKKIKLIPNGINLDKFSRSNVKKITKSDFGVKGDVVIVYVSRLNIGKNHMCLLEAWVEVTKQFSNVNLCIVGDGVLREALNKKCKILQIQDSVTFLGSIENVEDFLFISDIGISLIEKMSMELPVITSDIDVFKDVILDTENGFICSVNNSSDYAEKLITLIKNENLRITIGKNARKSIEKFDIKRITNDTIRFYEE